MPVAVQILPDLVNVTVVKCFRDFVEREPNVFVHHLLLCKDVTWFDLSVDDGRAHLVPMFDEV